MFPSNAYAEQCLLGDSDTIFPSKHFSSNPFFSLSPSFDHGCANGHFLSHVQDNELQLLTQSLNCSSLDTARRSETKVKSSMAPQEGVTVLSFPPDNTDAYNNKVDNNDRVGNNCIFVAPAAAGGRERKRSGKKDRHSKILTAQGTRDRRMRLSLEIARKFFGLQDKLGFDKASKTVEWLMMKAKVAIEEVTGGFRHPKGGSCGAKSVSSTSECDATSGLEETPADYNDDEDPREQEDASVENSLPPINPRCKKTRPIRKTAFHDPHAREKRANKRARARERTERNKSQSESRPSGDRDNICTFQSLVHQGPSLTINDVIKVPVSYKSVPGPVFDHRQQAPLFRGANCSALLSLHSPDVVYNFSHQDWDISSTSATHASIHYC